MQFQATTVTVSRLKAGPRQYENERLEVTVQVPEGQSAEDAVKAARGFIAEQFGEKPSKRTRDTIRKQLDDAEGGPNVL